MTFVVDCSSLEVASMEPTLVASLEAASMVGCSSMEVSFVEPPKLMVLSIPMLDFAS